MSGPLIFAHRGAPSQRSNQNTIEAFQAALARGPFGLESDIGLTRDGVPVLAHVGISLRRGTGVGSTERIDLPARVPSLRDVYVHCGTNFDLSLDMTEPRAVESVVATASEFNAVDRLWLTYWRLPALHDWRRRWPELHLVYPTIPLRRRSTLNLIDRLADNGITALNVHHRFCRSWMLDTTHRRDMQLFAWGIKSRTAVARTLRLGVDGMYCDNLDDVLRQLPADKISE